MRADTAVLFLRGRAGDDPVTCLWLLDLATGTERLLATGVRSYAADAAGELVAFARDDALWTVRIEDGELRPVPASGPVADPRPDPGGRRIAYVSGGSLRIAEAGADRALLTAEGPDVT